MTQPHAATHAPNKPYFAEPEWERLQGEDRHAGAVIVGLMTAIFSIGLVLYFIILLIV